jgi:hypothetical protein
VETVLKNNDLFHIHGEMWGVWMEGILYFGIGEHILLNTSVLLLLLLLESSVSIPTTLRAKPKNQDSIPGGGRDIVLRSIQTGSEAHHVLSFCGGKAAGA